MQAHMFEVYFRQNCILPNFLKNKFPFMLPSHNCIIIIDIQFSRCILNLLFKKLSEASTLVGTSINLFKWWRVPGSNRWPPACKAGALPAELTPHLGIWEVVGQNGLEPSTSRLSVVCSSQLSYWPISASTIFRYIFSVPSKLNNAQNLKTLFWP